MKSGHPRACQENRHCYIDRLEEASVQEILPVDRFSNTGIYDMHFPTIYKKMKTEKCQNAVEQTTDCFLKVNEGSACTSESNSVIRCQCNKVNESLSFRSILVSGNNKETRRKRSRSSSTRVQNIASMVEISEQLRSTRSNIMQEVGNSH